MKVRMIAGASLMLNLLACAMLTRSILADDAFTSLTQPTDRRATSRFLCTTPDHRPGVSPGELLLIAKGVFSNERHSSVVPNNRGTGSMGRHRAH